MKIEHLFTGKYAVVTGCVPTDSVPVGSIVRIGLYDPQCNWWCAIKKGDMFEYLFYGHEFTVIE